MKNMKAFIVSVLCLLAVGAIAQPVPYYQTQGVAINGYDAVAYFSSQSAVKGSADFTHQWSGATWQFSTRENRDLFIANPEKYAPQFGGYCAYGVSENHKSPTDPAAFTIMDGKLYLNYNLKVKTLWLGDVKSRIAKAEQYWPSLIDKP